MGLASLIDESFWVEEPDDAAEEVTAAGSVEVVELG